MAMYTSTPNGAGSSSSGPRPRRRPPVAPVATTSTNGGGGTTTAHGTTVTTSESGAVTSVNGTRVRPSTAPTIEQYLATGNRYVTSAGDLRDKYLGGREGRKIREALEGKLADAVAKSAGKISNPALGPRQTAFVSELARLTGLDPRVLAGMAASEQPADSPSIEGSDNWLNIGYYDSGPGGPTQDPRFFQGPLAAAKLTADFLKGKELGASEGIQAIMNTAGQSPEAQIAAIQNSGWASSGHPNLPELAAQTTVAQAKPLPQGLRRRAERVLGGKTTQAIIDGDTAGGFGPQGTKVPTLIKVGKKAERKFGVEAREQPFFDPVDPVHTSGSMHYSGDAIDFQGSPDQLMALDKWLARKYGSETAELFYDPGTSISDGAETAAIGGHDDHVHFGLDESSKGVIATPVGGAAGGTGASTLAGLSGGGTAPGAPASAAPRRPRASASGTTPIQSYLAPSAPLPTSYAGNPANADSLVPPEQIYNSLLTPRRRVRTR